MCEENSPQRTQRVSWRLGQPSHQFAMFAKHVADVPIQTRRVTRRRDALVQIKDIRPHGQVQPLGFSLKLLPEFGGRLKLNCLHSSHKCYYRPQYAV
jgi:hypothetical protein